MVATLEELDEKGLVRVLTEPRNSLIKQYEKLLSFERVELKVTDSALGAIAQKAIAQKTGARGLRSVLEEVMLDLMYELPSLKNVKECILTEDVINGSVSPILLYESNKEMKSA